MGVPDLLLPAGAGLAATGEHPALPGSVAQQVRLVAALLPSFLPGSAYGEPLAK